MKCLQLWMQSVALDGLTVNNIYRLLAPSTSSFVQCHTQNDPVVVTFKSSLTNRSTLYTFLMKQMIMEARAGRNI